MVWFAVDANGDEYAYDTKPVRDEFNRFCWCVDDHGTDDGLVKLNKGTIKQLIGIELSWGDEPIDF